MLIVDSFVPWLQVFFLSMSEPTGRTLISLVSGWLLLPGRSLADRIRAAEGQRHRASYYRLFSSAAWSLDAVSWRLLLRLLRWWPQKTLLLVGDDTLLPRKGPKVFAAGMHRDACLSTRSRTVKRWGHCWVVLGVVLTSRHDPHHSLCLPVMLRLFTGQATAKKLGWRYQSKSELMLEMLTQLERRLPQQKLHFLGDYGYTAPALLARIPERIEVTGRAHRRARLYRPAPPPSGRRGRPKVRGERLASPEQLLAAGGKRRTLRVTPHRRYRVRLSRLEGCFYQAPRRRVQVVALEHLSARRESDVFYSTVRSASAARIVCWYAQRFSIETTFRDCKQHLAIGRAHSRSRRAVERTAGTGLLLYSLVMLWHESRPAGPARPLRDYPTKRHPSLADILATLRRETFDKLHDELTDSPNSPVFHKKLEYLQTLIALAA